MNDVKIIADLAEHEQSRVAILEDGRLSDLFIEYSFSDDDDPSGGFKMPSPKVSRLSRQGDIFMGRVETILPAINAAFVSLSAKSSRHSNDTHNAFLYLSEGKSLRAGQHIIVQVTKNARQNKAPRVSTRISVPGRWLVIVPDSDELGVSRRIADNQERRRLKVIAEALKAENPGFGVVIRTAAEGVSEELLRSDLASLLSLWQDIKAKAKNVHAPGLLYRDMGTLGRVLRDDVSGKIDQIIINDKDEFADTQSFLTRFFPDNPELVLYEGTAPIFEYFGIEAEIQKALDRKVWLRSGAYLVIDQTEALTVIDVNSGKFTSAEDMRQTTLAVNLEAADEIARQIRLRSIGGIVVTDFIDMESGDDRNTLLKHFAEILRPDRLKARVFSITQLGLVELTRKRERPDLRSVLTRTCPYCNGDGVIEREESIALRIKRFIRKVTSATNAEAYVLQANRHIAEYISHYLDEWEMEFGRKIFIIGIHGFDRDKFRLEYQGDLKSAEAHAKLCLEDKFMKKGCEN
ncbi:MAG: Rne/Rng family ribonuclease [Synergistaceae bacterium]|nr:Rne/Rng family ribonuclease [Synergistaceae bacterium]